MRARVSEVSAGRWSWVCCLMLIAASAAGMAALSSYHYINPDVAFLTWTANEVLGPAVFGKDILDVNPPLAMMIYVPAALLAPLAGFDGALRLCMALLASLSILRLWQTANPPLRLPLAALLSLFLLLAFPDFFAQREQIAFLLCVPYVTGPARTRGGGVVNGLMAGVGFLIKPHFLIPLILVLAARRRIGTEERVIAAMGVAYGIALILFFRPYLFEMVPAATATYWAIKHPWTYLALMVAAILLSSVPLAIAARPQGPALAYLMAAFGFTLAALLQGKGFNYHFIPAYGFLILFLTAMVFIQPRRLAAMAAMFLLLQFAILGKIVAAWMLHQAEAEPYVRELRAEIDSSRSYAAITTEPFHAFPFAIYTPSRFEGTAIFHIFLPAVARFETGLATGDPSVAKRLALRQALTELRRKPELVIVFPVNVDDVLFDPLEWLKQDETFRDLWKDYDLARNLRGVELYRRK